MSICGVPSMPRGRSSTFSCRASGTSGCTKLMRKLLKKMDFLCEHAGVRSLRPTLPWSGKAVLA